MLGRRMIARRRRVGVLESDVPEYLVDNSSIGDERDDSHSAPAAGTQERIFLPGLHLLDLASAPPNVKRKALWFGLVYSNTKPLFATMLTTSEEYASASETSAIFIPLIPCCLMRNRARCPVKIAAMLRMGVRASAPASAMIARTSAMIANFEIFGEIGALSSAP